MSALARARARAEAYLRSLAGPPPGLDAPRAVYLAIAELQRRARQNPPPSAPSRDLTGYELRVFSQNGEDGVLDEILRRVGVDDRVFVEFGAGTGGEGVCVYLADVGGWAGRFIESDPDQFAALAAKYAMSTRVRTRRALVTPDNVESLFDELQVPERFDVLSIDIDGQDYWVWRAIDRYRPRVVVIEYNAHLGLQPLTVPPDVRHPWDQSDYFGASIGALRPLGADKGYRLVHCDLCGINAFFVRGDLVEDHFLSPEELPLRAPNYFLRGYRHPPGTGRWMDVGPPVAGAQRRR